MILTLSISGEVWIAAHAGIPGALSSQVWAIGSTWPEVMSLLGITERVLFVIGQVVLQLALGGQTANYVLVRERAAVHWSYSRVDHLISSH